MTSAISLTMKPLRFYSKVDENSLFRNLNLINQVKKVSHINDGIEIIVDRGECDWESFKDVMSLFIRYNVDMKMLKDLAPNEEVHAWFVSPERGWHGRL